MITACKHNEFILDRQKSIELLAFIVTFVGTT